MSSEPPNDLLCEQATLGAMLLSKTAIPQVTSILTAEDFYQPSHALIFNAIVELANAGEPVDAVTVPAKLREQGTLKRAGEETYILTLYQSSPAGGGAEFYARTVASLSRARRMRELGLRLQQLAEGSAVEDLDLAVGEGEKLFRDMHQVSSTAATYDQAVAAWMAEQEAVDNAIPTPWAQLNTWLNGGLRRGKVYVFAARPGVGKSIGILNVASWVGMRDYPTLVFSMEMGREEVMSRVLANGAEVNFGSMIRRDLDIEQQSRIDRFVKESRGMPLEIIDQEVITVEQIVSHCRARRDSAVVCVDYLQLIESSNHRWSDREAVKHISRSLKIAAKQLDVAVVVAAQLNRNNQNGKDGKPRPPLISDIGESGAVERDADAIILLHQDEGDDGVLKLMLSKNRNGRKGVIEAPFYGEYARIG